MMSIDFETSEVGFFDKKNKKDWSGHPRLAQAEILSSSNGVTSSAYEAPIRLPASLPRPIIFHNAGFDLPVGEQLGFWRVSDLPGSDFECTATMAKVSDNLRSAALKELARNFLGEKVVYFQEAKKDRDKFLEYAKKDAEYTARLYPMLRKELKDKGLWELYESVEKPFILVNSECQRNGITLDTERLTTLLQEIESENIQLEKKLPDELNWRSPLQILEYLHVDLNLPLQLEKGRPSTSEKSLKKLLSSPEVNVLLSLKENSARLQSLKQLERFQDPHTKKIYPYIHPLGAETGRATSTCPNLQNIEKGSVVRELFVASEGCDLIVLDFSQIEPRVLAHFLPNTNYSRLFDFPDKDFYLELSSRFLSKSAFDGKACRDIAKVIILATFYGMGSKTLAETLSISTERADEILNDFQTSFPEIFTFKQQVFELARKNGFSTGLLGRRRYIVDLNSPDKYLRAGAERKAFNAVIQGSAATVFKFKLVQLRSELPSHVRFLNHVHDEVILECPKQYSESVFLQAKEGLERKIDWFNTPIKVDGGIGSNWRIAKK